MPTPEAIAADTRATRARMEKLAWLLDGSIPVPGTKFRFGIEPLIGLIPGVGDALGLLLGAGILYESVRIGAPRSLLVKMLGNAGLDAVAGVVPGLGDLFDFVFKSNKRNALLLIEHLDRIDALPAASPPRGSKLLALLMATSFVGLAAALLWWVWSRLLT